MCLKKYLVIGLTFLLSGFAEKSWSGGIGSSGGGDSVVQDFIVSAYAAHTLLTEIKDRIVPAVDLAGFKSAIVADHIVSTDDKIMNNGVEVTAYYNHVTDKISVNRSRWREINKAPEKQRLAAHEILRRIGVNDDNYQVSSLLPDKDVLVIKMKISHENTKPREYDDVDVFDDVVSIPAENCSIYRGEPSHCRGAAVMFHEIDGVKVRTEVSIYKLYHKGKLKHYNVSAYVSYDEDDGPGRSSGSTVFLYDLSYKNIGMKVNLNLRNDMSTSGKQTQMFWDIVL